MAYMVSGAGCAPGSYTTGTAGATQNWTIGASCQVTITSPQAGTPSAAGTRYTFQQWNDADTNNPRTFTAPSSPATFTASLTTQYQLTSAVPPAGSGTVK